MPTFTSPSRLRLIIVAIIGIASIVLIKNATEPPREHMRPEFRQKAVAVRDELDRAAHSHDSWTYRECMLEADRKIDELIHDSEGVAESNVVQILINYELAVKEMRELGNSKGYLQAALLADRI